VTDRASEFSGVSRRHERVGPWQPLRRDVCYGSISLVGADSGCVRFPQMREGLLASGVAAEAIVCIPDHEEALRYMLAEAGVHVAPCI
jgi:hypothetical protein